VTGTIAANITTSFSAFTIPLTLSNGTRTLYLQAATSPSDFVISATSSAGGAFTLDDFSLKEVDGGDLGIRSFNVRPTITAAGTTGDQTINRAAGSVNIAAAGTTVTVTNSLVTADSIVLAVCAANDATAWVKNVVPGAGSFVINLGAAATAETRINWFIVN
jgi:hypothetical protein